MNPRKETVDPTAVGRITALWNGVLDSFLHGEFSLPDPLDRWFAAYTGSGPGAVDTSVFPEPFLGSLERPRAVFLALNPGPPAPEFQRPDGIFAEEIRRLGSYSAWAATWPYMRDPWESRRPRQRFHQARRRFLRDWFGNTALNSGDMVALELFPWHSHRVTGSVRPDPDIIQELVWLPIAELGNPPIFAFGAPWFPVLEALGVQVVARLGRGGHPYPSRVPGRAVLVGRTEAGSLVVAERHPGSAGPPASDEVQRLRDELALLGIL